RGRSDATGVPCWNVPQPGDGVGEQVRGEGRQPMYSGTKPTGNRVEGDDDAGVPQRPTRPAPRPPSTSGPGRRGRSPAGEPLAPGLIRTGGAGGARKKVRRAAGPAGIIVGGRCPRHGGTRLR